MVKANLHPGQNGKVYGIDGISPTICAAEGVKTQTKILVPANTKLGVVEMEMGGVMDVSYPNSKTRRGRVQDGGKTSPALTCHTENTLRRVEIGYRIRKLTPRECFRLMGVKDEDINKLLTSGISDSQLYKLAGNSIVINCIASVLKQLFK